MLASSRENRQGLNVLSTMASPQFHEASMIDVAVAVGGRLGKSAVLPDNTLPVGYGLCPIIILWIILF